MFNFDIKDQTNENLGAYHYAKSRGALWSKMDVWLPQPSQQWQIIQNKTYKTQGFAVSISFKFILKDIIFEKYYRDMSVDLSIRYIQQMLVQETVANWRRGPLLWIVLKRIAMHVSQMKTLQNWWSSVTHTHVYPFLQVSSNFYNDLLKLKYQKLSKASLLKQ